MQNFSALLLNLDRDTARREHMEAQLAQAHIAFTRLPGILGDAVPDDLRSSFYDASGKAKTSLKRGEVGCYASHLAALKRVAAGEFGDAVLIMEDDLKIAPDLIEIIAEARAKAPNDWDILRLCNPSRSAYVPTARLSGNRVLARYSRIPVSAGAYVITPKGARKFLQNGVRGLPYDIDLRRPWFHGMKTSGVLPPPIKAGVLKSTIDAIEAGRCDANASPCMERMRRGDLFYAFKRLAYNMNDLGVRNWLICCGINIADKIAKLLLKRSITDEAAKIFWIKE